MEKRVNTLTEFEAEATRFINELMPASHGATLITLSGELGAGKTAFTKAVAKTLGVEEVVTSPTFVLEKIYPLSKGKFKNLVHIDAYRLTKGNDLAPLAFDECIKDTSNLVLFEWPERVVDALPTPARAITITVHQDGSRLISYG
jgi:tRNA threonylcarbamoyladenosine biosynthesis protein TsaE